MATPLSEKEVREYVSDYAVNNYLIDGEEFSETFITLCMSLCIDTFNNLTPVSRFTDATFPSKTVLLMGTCYHMYQGKAMLLARNTMQYQDGGLTIPIEERAELYKSLSEGFRGEFLEAAKALKIQANMESGWGAIYSDESFFPNY